MGGAVRARTVIGVVVAGAALVACSGPRAVEAELTVRGATVAVYVADSEAERSSGLQGLDLDGAAGGMLFVWPSADVRSFAIKRVDYPLDVIWISGDGHVLGVSSLAPEGPERAVSPGATTSVLEVPAGWAARHGVAEGDPVWVRRR